MSRLKSNYPHPVLLENGDDYNPEFYFRTALTDEVKFDDENIIIPVEYSLNSEGLKRLIRKDDAVCGIKVYCSATFYSDLFLFKQNSNKRTILVPRDTVTDKLYLTGQIIAKYNLDHPFKDDELNKTYFENMHFEIPEASYLALDESISTIYLNTSVMEGPISSIFTIVRNNTCPSPEPQYETDTIIIEVDDETYRNYNEINTFEKGILVPQTMMNVIHGPLVSAIERIKLNQLGMYEDVYMSKLQWYEVIMYQVKQKNIDFTKEAVTIADALLGKVCAKSLSCVRELLDSGLDD